jgi:hypothetical protein
LGHPEIAEIPWTNNFLPFSDLISAEVNGIERNQEVGEKIIRRSYGSAIHSALNKIKSNYCWTDYTAILLCAAAFQIDIAVLSPCQGLDLLASQACNHYNIETNHSRGLTYILYHEFNKSPNIRNQNPNHFSLMRPAELSSDPRSYFPSAPAISVPTTWETIPEDSPNTMPHATPPANSENSIPPPL